MRHVEHVMGTVFSFDLRPPLGDARQAITEAVAWLHHVDAVFSTYRPDSPVSRLAAGKIGLDGCPPQVADVLKLCDSVSEVSDGYFTVRPSGRLDPSGLVKGWAVEQASRILTRCGVVNHCVNGGGDVQCAGRPAPDRPWRVAVAHPLRPGATATVITGPDVALATSGTAEREPALAVATSGTAERGAHIIDPRTGRPARHLVSITLTGTSLTMVDAYATAAFAMGAAARAWIERLPGVEAFAVTATGATWRTSGFRGTSPPVSEGVAFRGVAFGGLRRSALGFHTDVVVAWQHLSVSGRANDAAEVSRRSSTRRDTRWPPMTSSRTTTSGIPSARCAAHCGSAVANGPESRPWPGSWPSSTA
ncbi:FAD:protein FMN transferase [Nonomuraea sp. NPDC052265]|uniref:FAD:protein FMN transferase n=1 Tax=Nonomuraea sp. NPDC052265 TaxID=3364374 RepID=UPI0037CADB8C